MAKKKEQMVYLSFPGNTAGSFYKGMFFIFSGGEAGEVVKVYKSTRWRRFLKRWDLR